MKKPLWKCCVGSEKSVPKMQYLLPWNFEKCLLNFSEAVKNPCKILYWYGDSNVEHYPLFANIQRWNRLKRAAARICTPKIAQLFLENTIYWSTTENKPGHARHARYRHRHRSADGGLPAQCAHRSHYVALNTADCVYFNKNVATAPTGSQTFSSWTWNAERAEIITG